MAGDGKGKVGKRNAGWFEQSHQRFLSGVRDPRSTQSGPGIWETPEESAEEIAKSILRPKSAARPSSSPYAYSWWPEQVAERQAKSDSYQKSQRGMSSSSKGKPKGKGKSQERPVQQLHEKTIKEMRFENIVSLSFNPTRFQHVILGRPVVVSDVILQLRSLVQNAYPRRLSHHVVVVCFL